MQHFTCLGRGQTQTCPTRGEVWAASHVASAESAHNTCYSSPLVHHLVADQSVDAVSQSQQRVLILTPSFIHSPSWQSLWHAQTLPGESGRALICHAYQRTDRQTNMCACMYVHIYTGTHKHTHTRTRTHIHIRTCTHTHRHTHTCTRAHTHTRTHTRARTHTHVHTHTHTHTNTHILHPELTSLTCNEL